MEFQTIEKKLSDYSKIGVFNLSFKDDSETPNEIRVGWDSAGLLRNNSPQSKILTRGLTSCYAVFGENIYTGDKILGHFYYRTTIRQERDILKRKLPRGVSLNDFDLFQINGESGRKEGKYICHVDLSYDRGKNLWQLERIELPIEDQEMLIYLPITNKQR